MSSSISSSRKGRPNTARDEQYITVVGDFRPIIHRWQEADLEPRAARTKERMRSLVMEPWPDQFKVEVVCLSTPSNDWGELIELDETLSLPAGSKVRRGPVGVYKYLLHCTTFGEVVTEDKFVRVNDDADSVDLLAAPIATEQEIREAASYEPPVEVPVLPPAPVFKTLPRTEGDCASFLGFTFGGPDERNIRLPQCWQGIAFHIASPQIIGAISGVPGLQLKLFDSWGNLLLESFQSMPTVRFDQRRLEPGDYLLAFYGPGIEARGTYVCPNARLVADEPVSPILNDVLWGAGKKPSGHQLAVPAFRFEA